jgi:hypothetical protein
MHDAVKLDLLSVPRWCGFDGWSSRGGGAKLGRRAELKGRRRGFTTTLAMGGAAGKKCPMTPLGGARGEPTNQRIGAPFSTSGRRGQRGQVGGANSVRARIEALLECIFCSQPLLFE